MNETRNLAEALELLERTRAVISTQMPEWKQNVLAWPVVSDVDAFLERLDDEGAVRLDELEQGT